MEKAAQFWAEQAFLPNQKHTELAGLENKKAARWRGGVMPTMVAALAPIYQGDCKKSISNWMNEERPHPEG
jgi:hypothetical protein